MDYPILDYFDDELIYNKIAFINNAILKYPELKKVFDLKINTAVFLFTKSSSKYAHLIRDSKKVYNFVHGSNTNKVYLYKNQILFALTPLGGPNAGGLMEELGMLGITNFIGCGSAGNLFDESIMNKLFVPDRAIRDEGTSYHYLPASIYTEPDKGLTDFLKNFIENNEYKYVSGTIWTTDSFYRETPKRISKRKEQGAIAVDMECASWCAIAKHHGYKYGQIFFFSDFISVENMDHKVNRINIRRFLIDLVINAAVKYSKLNKKES